MHYKTLALVALLGMSMTGVSMAGDSLISGTSGNVVKTVILGGPTHRLISIQVLEKLDKPCYVKAYSAGGSFSHQEVEQCKGSAPSGSSGKLATISYVTGVRVCHSTSGRVKGYTFYGVDSYGNAVSDTFQRANCSSWKYRRNCPTGEYAAGVELHFDAGTGDNSDILTGIRLKCGLTAYYPG